MEKLGIFLALLTLQIVYSHNFQIDNGGSAELTVTVEDNLGTPADSNIWSSEEVWSKRSVISVKSVKHSQAYASHTRPWTQQLANKLKELSRNKGFYKVRLHHTTANKETHFGHTFVDACLLVSSGLSETFTLLVDSHYSLGGMTQTLVSGSISTPSAAYCTPESTAIDTNEDYSLLANGKGEDDIEFLDDLAAGHNTTVVVRTPVPSVVPETATFVQKVESLNKEKMENKDNRSFFVKYWMYIVPFVILLVISNGSQDKQ